MLPTITSLGSRSSQGDTFGWDISMGNSEGARLGRERRLSQQRKAVMEIIYGRPRRLEWGLLSGPLGETIEGCSVGGLLREAALSGARHFPLDARTLRKLLIDLTAEEVQELRACSQFVLIHEFALLAREVLRLHNEPHVLHFKAGCLCHAKGITRCGLQDREVRKTAARLFRTTRFLMARLVYMGEPAEAAAVGRSVLKPITRKFLLDSDR